MSEGKEMKKPEIDTKTTTKPMNVAEVASQVATSISETMSGDMNLLKELTKLRSARPLLLSDVDLKKFEVSRPWVYSNAYVSDYSMSRMIIISIVSLVLWLMHYLDLVSEEDHEGIITTAVDYFDQLFMWRHWLIEEDIENICTNVSALNGKGDIVLSETMACEYIRDVDMAKPAVYHDVEGGQEVSSEDVRCVRDMTLSSDKYETDLAQDYRVTRTAPMPYTSQSGFQCPKYVISQCIYRIDRKLLDDLLASYDSVTTTWTMLTNMICDANLATALNMNGKEHNLRTETSVLAHAYRLAQKCTHLKSTIVVDNTTYQNFQMAPMREISAKSS